MQMKTDPVLQLVGYRNLTLKCVISNRKWCDDSLSTLKGATVNMQCCISKCKCEVPHFGRIYLTVFSIVPNYNFTPKVKIFCVSDNNHLIVIVRDVCSCLLALRTPPLSPPQYTPPHLLPLDMCHILGSCSRGINARLHGVVFLSVVH